MSKLSASDIPQFNLILSDVFGNMKFDEIAYPELTEALKQSCKNLGLEYLDTQAEKVFQLYEAMRQRTGVVLVGPSGSGKSTTWNLLKNSLLKMNMTLKTHILNPKSISRFTLLGHMDLDTREWTDGIITWASRQAVKETDDTRTWIILDGDIDPEWIESLNSVLDDNRLVICRVIF